MTRDLDAKTIIGLTVETYTVRFFTLGASFVSSILLARMLGPEGQGYIATVQFWSSLIASFLILGLDSTAVYFAGSSPGRFGRLARFLSAYTCVAAAVGILILYSVQRVSDLFRDQSALVWFASGLILTSLATALFNALYIGIGRLSLTNRISAVGTALYLAALLTLTLARTGDTRLVLLALFSVQALTNAYLIIRALRYRSTTEAKPIFWRELWQYALKVYAGNLAGFLYFRSNFMILSLSASMAVVGIYSIAQVFSDVILILPTTLINIIFPRVAGMPKETTIQRVSETARFSVAVTFVLAAGIAASSTVIVPLAFGRAYASAVGMVWILCLGAWVAAGGMVLSIYFNSTNKPEVPSTAAWIGFAVAASTTWLLAPRWGGYGAAVALSLSRAVVAGYMLILYLRDSRERLTTVILAGPMDWRRGFRLMRSVLP
jgi:O-antigen/teichoic acid export membrane protein